MRKWETTSKTYSKTDAPSNSSSTADTSPSPLPHHYSTPESEETMPVKTVLQNLQDANDAAEAAIRYTLSLRDAMNHAIEDLNESLRALQLAKDELAATAETMGFMPHRETTLPQRIPLREAQHPYPEIREPA